MKKFTFILALVLALQAGNLFSQIDDSEVVNFTAVLSSVINLNVTAGGDQTATFDDPGKYNLGIDAVGTTTITVESTSDWDLTLSAPNFTDGATASIPINNLGVWCAATGDHNFGTEVSCAYTSLAAACGLLTSDQTLIDNMGGNSGDATDNAFDLNWTMGTMQGSMNGISIFDQLSNGTIANIGNFTTTVNLTVTEK